MKVKKHKKKIRSFINICFSLLLTFCLISVFEFSYSFFSGKEIPGLMVFLGLKFLNHFFTILFITAVFLPIFFFFARKKKKRPHLIVKLLFFLLVIIEVAFTKYSLITTLNLGVDLLGYSLEDVYKIATSSNKASVFFYLPFLIFPILFLVSNFFLKKAVFFKYSGKIFIGIAIGVVIMKFSISGFSDPKYQNKTYYFVADIIKFQIEKREVKSIKLEGKKEYPFLKPSIETPDVLGSFFKINIEKPNIVVVIVEGLGSEFVGKKEYGGFTPYLNSLIPKSLYWDNFLSNTGRTFGAITSLLGSLPFGEKGFLEIENTPTHLSLFSILKKQGYTTSYFSGDQSSFDKKINFLEYNAVENIIDENKYDKSYLKSVSNINDYSWGYSDAEIFEKTLSVIDDIQSPRLSVISTLTVHDPFNFPLKNKYLTKVDSILKSPVKIKIKKKKVIGNKDVFASILYADNSIKMFIEAYKKRPDFKNTIFIITGDHRLIPIAQKDKLCRFNVPFFIYSPMLKKTAKMKSINSHFDFTPSILAFLANNYNVALPKETSWLGSGIDTSKTFRNIHEIPLMRYKGGLNDFVNKDYLYSDGDLFKIKEDLNTYKISDKTVLSEITTLYKNFKKINAYVTQYDKIYPKNEDVTIDERYKFTSDELKILENLTANLSLDEMFITARKKAFNKEGETARLICNYILKKSPNYLDVRILKGRTLAWDGMYVKAEKELLDALKKAPYYDDIYLALLDLYWWSSQNQKAKLIVDKAKNNKIKNKKMAFKISRAYVAMNEVYKAKKIIDSILEKEPKNKEFIKLKNSLK